MSSGSPPSLPPANIAQRQATALTNNIAVRIITIPDAVRADRSQHIRLNGTVIGQNNDGSVSLQTNRGNLTIALPNRGNLPIGSRIDVDIPAGRNPQQATISSSPAQQNRQTSQNTERPNFTSAVNSLEIQQNITTDSLTEVLQQSGTARSAAEVELLAEAPIEPDQVIRLTPTILSNAQNARNLSPETQAATIKSLLNILANLPSGQVALRTAIMSLLAGLTQTSPALTSLLSPPAPNYLTQNIQKILEHPENKHLFQSLQQGKLIGDLLLNNLSRPDQTPAATANNTYPATPQSSLPLNLAKPLNAQIIGFLPATILSNPSTTNTSGSPYINTADVTSLLPPLGTSTLLKGPQQPVFIGEYLGPVGAKGLPVIGILPPPTPITSTISATQDSASQMSADLIQPAPLLFTLSVTPTNIPVGSPVLMHLTSAAPHIPLPEIITSSNIRQALQDWLGQQASDPTWDSLNDMVTLLNHTSPAQAQSLNQMLPSPALPHNAGPLSLLFLSMIRSGDINEWMGRQNIDELRKNLKGIDLLRALTSEASMLKQSDSMLLTQDWRMMMLPFTFQQQVQKTPIYYKHLPSEDDQAQNEQNRKARRLRFLFDLNLSRMGGVQVDGFMQNADTAQRLDIILRTKTSLSAPMQDKMRQVYAGAMEKSHLTGELSFQFRPEQWVNIDMGLITPTDTLLV